MLYDETFASVSEAHIAGAECDACGESCCREFAGEVVIGGDRAATVCPECLPHASHTSAGDAS